MDLINMIFISMSVIECFSGIVIAIGVSILAVRALKN